jgi:hypothetical protein
MRGIPGGDIQEDHNFGGQQDPYAADPYGQGKDAYGNDQKAQPGGAAELQEVELPHEQAQPQHDIEAPARALSVESIELDDPYKVTDGNK